MDVGKSLQALQRDRGVRNRDLVKGLGATAPEVSRWRKIKDAKISMVKRWADFFGLTIDEFINYE